MIPQFSNVLIFLFVGFFFVAFSVFLSRLLHSKSHAKDKFIPYECGEEPVGDTRIKFNTRFYIIALIFLIFEIEIVLLLPWGVVFKDLGGLAFVEMLIFAVILLVGLIYVWAKGDLDWIKTIGSVEGDETAKEELSSSDGVTDGVVAD